MRALLVVNPKATTTSERARAVLVRALRSEMDVRLGETRRRGHGAELARQAARDGLDVVVALGGDGTVNEVVNGILTATPRSETSELPALAVVPGGSTNVFARALGLPNDAVEATGALIEAVQEGRTRSIGLGRADGRYFTFCAGFGIDAEVVRKVERARLRGKVSTPALYLRSTVSQFFLDTERRTPLITLDRPGEKRITGIASVIVQNTTPWTYLGGRAITACPDASFETGLDLMAMRSLHVPATALVAASLLTGARPTRHPAPRPSLRLPSLPRLGGALALARGVVARPVADTSVTERHDRQMMTLHDLSAFTLIAARPLAFQLDGDYLGERTKVTFSAVPDALRVFC
jgi:diacylglycerol kinase family enzyme